MKRTLEPEYMDTEDDASSYDEMDHSGPNEAFVDRLFELGARGRMLDLGTGPGHIPLLICERDPDARIVAIDAAESMLKIATRHRDASPHRERIELQRMDAKKLELPDDSFDVVYSNTILHHIPDPKPFLAEAWRVLRPGGVLLIRDLFRPETPQEAERLVELHTRGSNEQQKALFRASLHAALTPDELEAMVDELGIDGVNVVIDSDRHMSLQTPSQIAHLEPRLFLVHPGPRALKKDEERGPVESPAPRRVEGPPIGAAIRPTRWSRRAGRASKEARDLESALGRIERLIDRGEGGGEALELLTKLPSGPFLEASFHLRIGDAYFDLGEHGEAQKHFEQVLSRDPSSADALYRMGLIDAEAGRRERMIERWLEVRKLDLAAPRPPWAISEEEFIAVAEQAFEELPPVVKKKLANLPLIATDYPSEDLVADGLDPRILGVITGAPLPEKSAIGEGAPQLDVVQLYQRNIERICTNATELRAEIRITVIHETGHYFGLDDDDLDGLGLG